MTHLFYADIVENDVTDVTYCFKFLNTFDEFCRLLCFCSRNGASSAATKDKAKFIRRLCELVPQRSRCEIADSSFRPPSMVHVNPGSDCPRPVAGWEARQGRDIKPTIYRSTSSVRLCTAISRRSGHTSGPVWARTTRRRPTKVRRSLTRIQEVFVVISTDSATGRGTLSWTLCLFTL